MIIYECDTEMQECPSAEHMQMQLAGPSQRLVHVLLSVSVTKLVSDALDNILSKPAATGYTVFEEPELIKMKGHVADHKVIVLFDSASTHNVIDSKLIKRLKLKTSPSDYAYKVKMADESSTEVWDHRVTELELRIQDYVEKLDFELTRLAHADIALGMTWHF